MDVDRYSTYSARPAQDFTASESGIIQVSLFRNPTEWACYLSLLASRLLTEYLYSWAYDYHMNGPENPRTPCKRLLVSCSLFLFLSSLPPTMPPKRNRRKKKKQQEQDVEKQPAASPTLQPVPTARPLRSVVSRFPLCPPRCWYWAKNVLYRLSPLWRYVSFVSTVCSHIDIRPFCTRNCAVSSTTSQPEPKPIKRTQKKELATSGENSATETRISTRSKWICESRTTMTN